ncbi:LysR family transcriptional regulator [Aerococcus sanguinicola]|uniref:LysR family transcriptional regulator n=3 Tax=Aerococcus TaxID=1375 RepID=A0A0X8FBW9_9LACT|nr:LysR family transcriptional regulator [Aerococcus sanguinicola]AMB93682.1 LysR family transcriptional regulator [Aerococcus sanguinicola]MDK7050476.1 LysR family transcriptional regulator [Aerococcus sanguinicola]PKZ21589.1 LysR family transcriptional regulator [Aerococcus sanguinicola]
MRLEDFKYFQTVASELSLSQAANKLYISQPSLSNAMTKLEKELDVTLFTRSSRGISLTTDGEEFLQYANQILEQMHLVERRYFDKEPPALPIFSIVCHHYAFVVEAFSRLLKRHQDKAFQASVKELRTYEVIEEVYQLRSELGVIYRSHYNRQIIDRVLSDKHLSFTPLVTAKPHIFTYKGHPLADKDRLTFDDLAPYPRLNFDQGKHNSFYFWEEVHADQEVKQSIVVSDRATIFNLMIGLNGYTISSGIINANLNGEDIIAIPLDSNEEIEIGYLTNDTHTLNPIANEFIIILENCLKEGIEKQRV